MVKLDDVLIASKLIDGEEVDNYGRLYYSSSENLDEIFKRVNVEGKDVLTILGSSDQYFYAYYYGAKSVESFDINKLTKYYYYLRLWGIKYLDEFYPDIHNHRYIYELLKLVECSNSNEEEAYSFWNNYIRSIYPFDNTRLFYVNGNSKRNIDIDKLNDSIYGRKNNFYNANIKNSFTDKKYDVIMLSNMLEYCLGDLSVVRDNIDSLLKDNGVVVCSNMLTNGYMEHKVFSEVFNRVSLGTYRNNDYFGMEFPLGYVYKKDVNKK